MIYGAAVSRRAWSILITALIAFVLVGAGVIGSVRADDGLSRTSTVVDGVPLTVIRSASADAEPRPGAGPSRFARRTGRGDGGAAGGLCRQGAST